MHRDIEPLIERHAFHSRPDRFRNSSGILRFIPSQQDEKIRENCSPPHAVIPKPFVKYPVNNWNYVVHRHETEHVSPKSTIVYCTDNQCIVDFALLIDR